MSKTKNILSIIAIILVFVSVFSLIAHLLGKKEEISASKPIEPSKIGNTLSPENGYISFLGDSITTYEGWSNNTKYNSTIGEYGSYYDSSKLSVTDTWWYKVSETMGYGLCVNNSLDAARVSATHVRLPSALERADNLHNDNAGILPDVIVIYLGTNDLANGVSVSKFEEAYDELLYEVGKYFDAKIYCCTLLPESRNADKADELSSYNDIIRTTARQWGYELIDFYNEIDYWNYNMYTFEDATMRVHPNKIGMQKMYEAVISIMKG